MSDKALVLFSGGQDSTVCLAWALSRFQMIDTIGFDYGQYHRIELDCRQKVISEIKRKFPLWKSKLGSDHIIDLSILGQISQTALTENISITIDDSGLPNTFVPGRNLLFFIFAAAIAYQRGFKNLVGGMSQSDFSGYPDCRKDTIVAQQKALNLGMDTNFKIITPLMWLDKAKTWKLAENLGGVELTEIIIQHTHTCYKGNRSLLHSWGYGCADCPACLLRQRGYETWLRTDS
ncbi:MAG: 7-cyano-7-deazaguanine synthase QueC [Hyphomicrobiaceae bacterium]|nr:7-cyano-7-deazaguanine synthase QueC [Hyphomicrobiaceae bacterium]